MKRLLILLCIGLCCWGQISASQAAEVTSKYPSVKPVFSERFRLVTWDNAISLDKDAHAGQTFTRHRTIAGGELSANKRISFKLTLGNEFRHYVVPENKYARGLNEIFFENAYAKFRIGGVYYPLTFTIGRQNIILGEGFAVMDGNPLDGSRAIYFDAVRLDARISESTMATVFACSQTPTDNRLPIIHDVDQALIEHDEDGAGLYISTKYRHTEFQPYYLYKNIPDWRLHTIGNRVETFLSKRTAVVAEAAIQFGSDKTGTHNDGRLGYAGYAYFNYAIQHPKLCLIEVKPGLFYYSGDDENSSKYEGWDPLFARWPKWSESYIYTQLNEEGVAYWTNIYSFYIQLKLKNITPGLTCLLDYYALYAPHANVNSYSATNLKRGDLLIAKFNFRINEHVTGHFLWESFFPDQFHSFPYSDVVKLDNYSWIRAELLYKL